MENTDRTRKQGGQGQGNKPGQGGNQKPGQGGREGRGSQDGRPAPSGVPNEGYEYKGGRQGTGGVPNPDDQDDLESAGSFRGTAEQEFGEDDEDSERVPGASQNRNQDSNQPRNPK